MTAATQSCCKSMYCGALRGKLALPSQPVAANNRSICSDRRRQRHGHAYVGSYALALTGSTQNSACRRVGVSQCCKYTYVKGGAHPNLMRCRPWSGDRGVHSALMWAPSEGGEADAERILRAACLLHDACLQRGLFHVSRVPLHAGGKQTSRQHVLSGIHAIDILRCTTLHHKTTEE